MGNDNEKELYERIGKMTIDDVAEIVKNSNVYPAYVMEVKRGVPIEYTQEFLRGLFCLFDRSSENQLAVCVASEKILFSMLDMRFRIEMQKGGENNED